MNHITGGCVERDAIGMCLTLQISIHVSGFKAGVGVDFRNRMDVMNSVVVFPKI